LSFCDKAMRLACEHRGQQRKRRSEAEQGRERDHQRHRDAGRHAVETPQTIVDDIAEPGGEAGLEATWNGRSLPVPPPDVRPVTHGGKWRRGRQIHPAAPGNPRLVPMSIMSMLH
jgi:hypothetical protein